MASDRKYSRKDLKKALRKTSRGPLRYMFIAIGLLASMTLIVAIAAAFKGNPPSRTPAEAGAEGPSSDPSEAAASTGSEEETVIPEGGTDIVIGATGSMLMHSPIMDKALQEDGTYDFSPIFEYIAPYYSAPDLMTCEMEGAVCPEGYEPSGHPMFRVPGTFITAIRDSGVDLQMLASNHIYDALTLGLDTTIDFYESNGIGFTGIRKTAEDKNYYIADINGVKVGYLNYTLQTAGDGVFINAIYVPAEDAERINTFNPYNYEPFLEEAKKTIAAMRKDGADFIVANMHWGIEYMLEPGEDQVAIAKALCDMGVDALIGGHPHCEEPVDVIESSDGSHSMFCIYSVGNALSNQREELMLYDMPGGYTEDGVIINMTVHKDADGTTRLTGVEAIPTWVYEIIDENGIWTNLFYILALDDVAHIEETTGMKGIQEEAQASYDRTMSIIGEGMEKAQKAFHP